MFDEGTEGGSFLLQTSGDCSRPQWMKMCCLPVDQPLLRPGDSSCARAPALSCSVAQLLASRLRRIGDRLEKGWTSAARKSECVCAEGVEGHAGVSASAATTHLKSFLCTAIHFTVLVLMLTRRHL